MSSSWTVPSTHGVVVIVRQRPALFVGDDQAVEPDDRGAVAGERVVDLPEERQAVHDRAERRRRLGHCAERDLAVVEPRELKQIGQRHDGLAHRPVPAVEAQRSVNTYRL